MSQVMHPRKMQKSVYSSRCRSWGGGGSEQGANKPPDGKYAARMPTLLWTRGTRCGSRANSCCMRATVMSPMRDSRSDSHMVFLAHFTNSACDWYSDGLAGNRGSAAPAQDAQNVQ